MPAQEPDSRRGHEGAVGASSALCTASIAHDLCNQLQVLAGALDVLSRPLQDAPPPARQRALDGASSALRRAGQLSRELVDRPRLADPGQRRTCIATTLAGLEPILALLCGPQTILETHIGDDLPALACEADALESALLNAVTNAAKAIAGAGRIVIAASAEPRADGRAPDAVIRVADSGCGMTPEVAARAFEDGFTTRPAGAGSGVGLASIADFARRAGGSVSLQSREGVGTIVALRLPGLLRQARHTPATSPDRSASRGSPQVG